MPAGGGPARRKRLCKDRVEDGRVLRDVAMGPCRLSGTLQEGKGGAPEGREHPRLGLPAGGQHEIGSNPFTKPRHRGDLLNALDQLLSIVRRTPRMPAGAAALGGGGGRAHGVGSGSW